jgi:hypothetical protein
MGLFYRSALRDTRRSDATVYRTKIEAESRFDDAFLFRLCRDSSVRLQTRAIYARRRQFSMVGPFGRLSSTRRTAIIHHADLRTVISATEFVVAVACLEARISNGSDRARIGRVVNPLHLPSIDVTDDASPAELTRTSASRMR